MSNQNPFAAFQNAATPAQTFAQNPQQLAAQPGPPTFGGALPAPGAFGQPPQQQFPQSAQVAGPGAFAPAPQQAPVSAGFSLPDLSDVGESGRNPPIPLGTHILVFKANMVKTFTGHTAIADFVVEQSNNPEAQPGAVRSFVKKMPTDNSKKKTAIGYALSMIRAMAGYADEASFKAAVPFWSQLLGAFIHGAPAFAQWANAGGVAKRVLCVGTQGAEIIDKGQRTGRYYVQLDWSPVK